MIRVKYTDQRRQSRTAALQSLFATDVRDLWENPRLEWLDEEEELSDIALGFAQDRLKGVVKMHEGVDYVIPRFAPAWVSAPSAHLRPEKKHMF